jgi:hypothetical protein
MVPPHRLVPFPCPTVSLVTHLKSAALLLEVSAPTVLLDLSPTPSVLLASNARLVLSPTVQLATFAQAARHLLREPPLAQLAALDCTQTALPQDYALLAQVAKSRTHNSQDASNVPLVFTSPDLPVSCAHLVPRPQLAPHLAQPAPPVSIPTQALRVFAQLALRVRL